MGWGGYGIATSLGTMSEGPHQPQPAPEPNTNAAPIHSPTSVYTSANDNTTFGFAEGLAKAHNVYGVEVPASWFVVQPDERNVFDQRWLEYELLKRHGIYVIRQTLADLAVSASLNTSMLVLTITLPSAFSLTNHHSTYGISTIYFLRHC
ncbi:hypothetical protein M405DRAFT_856534 [Rhizopogon salebrosus TDB-379]|nr:hypothetical protein M405DRAFT_856534 [Rhizopogon salebrosus TDB-379]